MQISLASQAKFFPQGPRPTDRRNEEGKEQVRSFLAVATTDQPLRKDDYFAALTVWIQKKKKTSTTNFPKEESLLRMRHVVELVECLASETVSKPMAGRMDPIEERRMDATQE